MINKHAKISDKHQKNIDAFFREVDKNNDTSKLPQIIDAYAEELEEAVIDYIELSEEYEELVKELKALAKEYEELVKELKALAKEYENGHQILEEIGNW